MLLKQLNMVKKMGVKIFNCSWSMSDYNVALETEMKNTDAVFVCAAGNFSGNGSILPTYPECFNISNVISVAAIDNNGCLAHFSNYGASIDVAAPGVSIISTSPQNEYIFQDGTSMATPFVSGIVALTKSKYSNYYADEIINRIRAGTIKDQYLKGIVKTEGFVNAYNSLQ